MKSLEKKGLTNCYVYHNVYKPENDAAEYSLIVSNKPQELGNIVTKFDANQNIHISAMSSAVKYFYKGKETDLVVFATSVEEVNEYRKEPSIGKLSQVAEIFKVFSNDQGSGAEGNLGEASKAQVQNEFGNKKIEEVIDIILREGKPNASVGQVKKSFNWMHLMILLL